MKKLIFAFSVIFFFTQCAKKTIETASNVQQNQVDKSWRKMAQHLRQQETFNWVHIPLLTLRMV